MTYSNDSTTKSIAELIESTRDERRAWVVFTNQTDLRMVGMLKKGYRHCFILINDGEQWISIDPMANYMDVVVHHVPCEFDMPNWLLERGHRVIPACLNVDVSRAAPLMLFTCVEACKRILGIHKRFIFTPWQLFKYLNKQNSKTTQRLSVLSKIKNNITSFFNKGVISWEV